MSDEFLIKIESQYGKVLLLNIENSRK